MPNKTRKPRTRGGKRAARPAPALQNPPKSPFAQVQGPQGQSGALSRHRRVDARPPKFPGRLGGR